MPTIHNDEQSIDLTDSEVKKYFPDKAEVYAYQDYSADYDCQKENIPFDDGEKNTDYPKSFKPKFDL